METEIQTHISLLLWVNPPRCICFRRGNPTPYITSIKQIYTTLESRNSHPANNLLHIKPVNKKKPSKYVHKPTDPEIKTHFNLISH